MTAAVELFRIDTAKVSLRWTTSDARQDGSGRDTKTLPSGTLRIVPRRQGLTLSDRTHRAGVPSPAASQLEVLAGPPLFEETTYSILLTALTKDAIELRHHDPTLLRGISNSGTEAACHGTLNFRSQVGLSRFSILVDGRPEFDFEVEVFPSKLEYREDYATMMGEVQDLAAGLALEYLRSTYQLGTATGSKEASRLDWLALLRHVVSDLEKAINYISAHPIRGMHREERFVRLESLRRSDSVLRRAVRAGVGRGDRVTLSSGVAVRRYLPERRAQQTLDTPEHRWLANQLKQVRLRLAQVIREEEARGWAPHGSASPASQRAAKALDELRILETRIERLERAEPLRGVRAPPPQGFTSLQLHGAPGYREAYRALTILRQGLRISGGPIELSVKDVHLLYEYWCFLAIVKLTAEVLDTSIPADHLLEVRTEGLSIRLRQGRRQSVPFELPGGRKLQVIYSPSYTNDVLLPQKPDIVLSLTDPNWPTIRLVLDAKYRVESAAEFVERFGVPGPPPDAVNVLHRYRDAILEQDGEIEPGLSNERLSIRRTVIEGAALYPLDAEAAANFEQSRFWNSLQRLGIGALPFLPNSTSWVEKWLRAVLRRSGWEVADAVISHAAEVTRAKWKRAAELPVLVGTLRSSGPAEHLNWIREHGLYYTPLTPTQPRQFHTRAIGFYEPASPKANREGGVRITAEVDAIEVLPRSSIQTPWSSNRDPEALQVVYRLSAFSALPAPVFGRGAQGESRPFRINRWTSALAVTRARVVSELLLESVSEWEFYDWLRTRGVGFEVRAAGRPRATSGAVGRAWFVTENGALRFVEPSWVEVRKDAQRTTGTLTNLRNLIT